jgi:hypothetical protein
MSLLAVVFMLVAFAAAAFGMHRMGRGGRRTGDAASSPQD